MRLIIECRGQKREYLLREGTTVVGRDPSCDIVFPESSLSRRHVECRLRGAELVVRDMDTKNGTFLGPQRIKEAHLPAGVRLRAGNVFLHFEPDAVAGEGGTVVYAPSKGRPAPAPVSTPDELARAVPPDAQYEEDEAPTPLEAPGGDPAAVAGEGARLVVRDGRWFVQDPATGAEVEIVPRQQAGAPAQPPEEGAGPLPAGAAVPARVAESAAVRPARPARPAVPAPTRRRRLLLLAGAAVLLLLLIVVAVALTRPKPQAPVMSDAQFRDAVDKSALLFRGGERAEAEEQLRRLLKTPTAARHELDAMLLAAFETDDKAVKDFQQGWETAQRRWDEVIKSSRSTAQVKELAKARYMWFQDEALNMGRVNDAKEFLQRGQYLKAMQCAASVADGSRFKAETEPIIQQAVDAVVRDANAQANERNWSEAIHTAQTVLKAKPDLAATLEPRITLWKQCENDRQALAQAAKAAAENRHEEAMRLLASINADSPYSGPAQALQKEVLKKGAVQIAAAAYNAGDGAKALDVLSKAGAPDPQLAAKIQAVMKAKAAADEALKAGRFPEAQSELEGILRLETPAANRYAQQAKSQLDGLPQLKRTAAQTLVDQSGAARVNRDFASARKGLEEALRLDPTNIEAREGLKELRTSAIRDFNLVLALENENLKQAQQLCQEVRDRLPVADEMYPKVANELYTIDQKLKAGGK